MKADLVRGREAEPGNTARVGYCVSGDSAMVNADGDEIEQDASIEDEAACSESGLPINPRGSGGAGDFDAAAERPQS